MADARLVRFRGVECQLESTDQALTVELSGEIDISVADELGSWLLSASEGYDSVGLDLTRVGFMDSTGLHLLIRLKRELGERLWLPGISEPVRGLLSVTGLTTFFD